MVRFAVLFARMITAVLIHLFGVLPESDWLCELLNLFLPTLPFLLRMEDDFVSFLHNENFFCIDSVHIDF